MIALLLPFIANAASVTPLVFEPDNDVFAMRFTFDTLDAAASNLFMVNGCPIVAQQSVAARIRGLPSRAPLLDMYETPLQRQRCGIAVRPSTNFVSKLQPTLPVYGYADAIYMRTLYAMPNAVYMPVCLRVRATLTEDTTRAVISSCRLDVGTRTDADDHACAAMLPIPPHWFPKFDNAQWDYATHVQLHYSLIVGADAAGPLCDDGTADGVGWTSIAHQVNLVHDNNSVDDEYTLTTIGTRRLSDSTAIIEVSTLLNNASLYARTAFNAYVHVNYDRADSTLMLHGIRLKCEHDKRVQLLNAVGVNGWTVVPSSQRGYVSIMRNEVNSTEYSRGWSGAIVELHMQVAEARILGMENAYDTVAGNNKDIDVPMQCSIDYAMLDETDNVTNGILWRPLLREGEVAVLLIFHITNDLHMSPTEHIANTAVLSGVEQRYELVHLLLWPSGRLRYVYSPHLMNCKSENVNHTCSVVYLDGSETNGDEHVVVHSSYALSDAVTLLSSTNFVVWYPQRQLVLTLTDPILQPINGWQLPTIAPFNSAEHERYRRVVKTTHCRPKYQETLVRVYARFVVGEGSTLQYLGGEDQRLMFDVSTHCKHTVRVANATVAKVRRAPDYTGAAAIVEGWMPGITSISIHLPFTHESYGATPLEVVSSAINLKPLRAAVASVVALNLTQHPLVDGAAVAHIQYKTTFTDNGAIALAVVYADDSNTDLSAVSASQYKLHVTEYRRSQLNVDIAQGTIGITPLEDPAWGIPIRIELHPPDSCQNPEGLPLTHTDTRIEAHFTYTNDSLTHATSVPPPQIVYDQFPTSTVERVSEHSLSVLEMCFIALLVLFLVMGLTMAYNYCTATSHARVHRTVGSPPTNYHRDASMTRYKFQKLLPTRSFCSLFSFDNRRCRLSNGSALHGQQCDAEWVWLGKEQLQGESTIDSGTGSVNSAALPHRNTHCHTLDGGRPHASYRYNDGYKSKQAASCEEQAMLLYQQRHGTGGSYDGAVSYRGSEVSIFISRQPSMQVHENNAFRHSTPSSAAVSADVMMTDDSRMYNGNARGTHDMHITDNPMLAPRATHDSSSERGFHPGSPGACATQERCLMAAAHYGTGTDWDATSLGMDDAELREYFGAMRESTA